VKRFKVFADGTALAFVPTRVAPILCRWAEGVVPGLDDDGQPIVRDGPVVDENDDGLRGKVWARPLDLGEIEETIAQADIIPAKHYTDHRQYVQQQQADSGLAVSADKDLQGGSPRTQVEDLKALVEAKLAAGQETGLLEEVAAWNASDAEKKVALEATEIG